jgi:hypothetical protein
LIESKKKTIAWIEKETHVNNPFEIFNKALSWKNPTLAAP